VIYSRWNPASGGYDYFQDQRVQNINDDLPTPELPEATKIGVPSIEAGRPIPGDAVPVGSGDQAVGILAPVDSSRLVRRDRSLAGIDIPASSPILWIAAGAAGVGLVWYFKKKR